MKNKNKLRMGIIIAVIIVIVAVIALYPSKTITYSGSGELEDPDFQLWTFSVNAQSSYPSAFSSGEMTGNITLTSPEGDTTNIPIKGSPILEDDENTILIENINGEGVDLDGELKLNGEIYTGVFYGRITINSVILEPDSSNNEITATIT